MSKKPPPPLSRSVHVPSFHQVLWNLVRTFCIILLTSKSSNQHTKTDPPWRRYKTHGVDWLKKKKVNLFNYLREYFLTIGIYCMPSKLVHDMMLNWSFLRGTHQKWQAVHFLQTHETTLWLSHSLSAIDPVLSFLVKGASFLANTSALWFCLSALTHSYV